ncbi:hypothetical protein JCM19239_6827 [Vibrio variabilis]|uniref:Uncharacterized protein n=1 Tax=Vibrio variabilis TaxID=990271 RepID=A0ABQ0JN50_9VIBR|nr:hypothetical protein JCM19239_6827 [Vibrio variabilis]
MSLPLGVNAFTSELFIFEEYETGAEWSENASAERNRG